MRRLLVAGVVVGMLMPLGAPGSVAAGERYQSQSLNAFWHSRKRVDADTYLRTTWYAGIYESGEGLWSDLYRQVQRCREREGRDRCRSDSFAYGEINDLGSGSFSIDSRLSAAHLEATYRLHTREDGERVSLGRAHLVADLEGIGDVTRSRDSGSSHSRCDHYRYSGKWRYRRAVARGTLDFRGARDTDLGTTRVASIARGQVISVVHEC